MLRTRQYLNTKPRQGASPIISSAFLQTSNSRYRKRFRSRPRFQCTPSTHATPYSANGYYLSLHWHDKVTTLTGRRTRNRDHQHRMAEVYALLAVLYRVAATGFTMNKKASGPTTKLQLRRLSRRRHQRNPGLGKFGGSRAQQNKDERRKAARLPANDDFAQKNRRFRTTATCIGSRESLLSFLLPNLTSRPPLHSFQHEFIFIDLFMTGAFHDPVFGFRSRLASSWRVSFFLRYCISFFVS